MIKIGGKIGALYTVALVFFTAILGIYYARIQGVQTLKSGLTNLYQNKAPIYELISGASIAFAAILLIIPGFFTDFIGFALLIPFTRNIFLKIALKNNKFEKNTDKMNKTIEGEIVNKNKDEL
tara:strand:- start:279 stop:647 length:369 start_codon:yes stop_codon:yes gene_type:complete